mmetsp:Transcript_73851/g.171297  ORF Transcript_73851/g.171297 Transcript_73851/m.171297 type:complete len:116 (+) Transcript_73851:95-442(+)|eukprot:CAMPEP_0171062884 /NCGR_PEP_ID=MMETSP0766_2-20121228/5305_1 /TAXON_ID=439317 /ORGANISM="Gambierdiscus australes, Strain CAWD 149" /LENGTH=115 /DNA_ID=CAMNT_0011518707 /DNA_START=83 /DNA_END=430 /DNA_ORIENTATION=-
MDSLVVANLKVSTASDADKRAERRSFARTELTKQRQKRGQLLFLDRMEADINNQRAFNHVCTLRQHRQHRDALDRAVDNLRPLPTSVGPRVVTYDSKVNFEGQNRKMQWGPLECY